MNRRRRLLLLLIVGLVGIALGLGASAITPGSRRDGEDDQRRLEISPIDLATGRRDTVLSARDMVPGDAVTATITVANSSREPMVYSMSHTPVSVDGGALSTALVLSIRTVGTSCADRDGTTLFEGPLGDAAFGSQGDGRPLSAATAEILCFRVMLPLDAGNGLQGLTTTVTLSFDATWQAAVP